MDHGWHGSSRILGEGNEAASGPPRGGDGKYGNYGNYGKYKKYTAHPFPLPRGDGTRQRPPVTLTVSRRARRERGTLQNGQWFNGGGISSAVTWPPMKTTFLPGLGGRGWFSS